MKTTRLLPYIFLAIGAVMLLVGIFLIRRTRQFIATAATAAAVVIDNVWSTSTVQTARI
ncbi:MAG TPA: hypothetical protein VMH81_38290 [Bryobacteraceae bacterium]|nr:hypothetical protein [Bryobacteraceae bacterium]